MNVSEDLKFGTLTLPLFYLEGLFEVAFSGRILFRVFRFLLLRLFALVCQALK